MTYRSSDFSVLAYANGFTLWHYKTNAPTITDAGYFNKAKDMLVENDLIIATVNIDQEQKTAFYIVTGIKNNNVTIAPIGF